MNRYEFQKRKLYSVLGKRLSKLLDSTECIIAGGSINSIFTNKDINDLDIYFRNEKDLIKVVKDIYDDYFILCNTKKATLFKNNSDQLVHLIHFRLFDNAKEIFNTFDFTVCMAAYDFKLGKFVFDDRFFLDNTQNVIRFNSNTAYPLMSMLRVNKYKNKGYNISKTEFIRILLTCMKLKIHNIEDLKEQLSGMYGTDLSKMFKDIENNSNGTINLEQVIDKLKDLYLDDDYFKTSGR